MRSRANAIHKFTEPASLTERGDFEIPLGVDELRAGRWGARRAVFAAAFAHDHPARHRQTPHQRDESAMRITRGMLAPCSPRSAS